MKKKLSISIIVLSSIILIGVLGYFLLGNPVVFINNQNLENSIKAIKSKTVELNDVVPFEWDSLYAFEPYQRKK